MSDHDQISREDRDFFMRFEKMFADTNAKSQEVVLNRASAQLDRIADKLRALMKSLKGAANDTGLGKSASMFGEHAEMIAKALDGLDKIKANCDKFARAQVDAERLFGVGRTIN